MNTPSKILPRISIIGPTLPYRGGIAQYTTMLHRALKSECNLLTISFRRQYPGWLYPGKSDIDPEYKDYQETGVHYILDSINPFTWLKGCRLIVEHTPHAVIIPWWSVFWTFCFVFIAKFLSYRGIPVVFLCHNVIEHESAFWKRILTRWVLSQSNKFLVHTKEEARKLKILVPQAHITVHPHPIYIQFPPSKGIFPRRAKLELLFFGLVRPYKGVDVLIEAMHLLKGEGIFLTIAGEWWLKDAKLRKRIEGLHGKVELVDRYIGESEVAEYFARCDVVVLPYRSVTGSGVIPVAYHYGKPVITTLVGGLPDVVEDGVSGRLVPSDNPYALADVIREFLNRTPVNMREGVRKVAERMTWESLVECTLDLCQKKE